MAYIFVCLFRLRKSFSVRKMLSSASEVNYNKIALKDYKSCVQTKYIFYLNCYYASRFIIT